MSTYNATIPGTLAPAGLTPSQLTSRPGWNFTYNVSDRATSDLKASQLTSCNHPLSVTNRFVCYLRLLRFTLRKNRMNIQFTPVIAFSKRDYQRDYQRDYPLVWNH